MEWSWTAWAVSVAAVIASGALARAEGNWRRRPGLDMGFANHGGMWGDLLLLPLANAAVIPQVTIGWWTAVAGLVSLAASLLVHAHWYEPHGACDHMWPSRARGTWARDLSWAGWAHVMYVAGELTIIAAFVLHPMRPDVVIFVAAIFTIHVPLGLLQPRWYLTGHIATAMEQPLLLPCLVTIWVATAIKL